MVEGKGEGEEDGEKEIGSALQRRVGEKGEKGEEKGIKRWKVK